MMISVLACDRDLSELTLSQIRSEKISPAACKINYAKSLDVD